MSIDTYGLEFSRYQELFLKEAAQIIYLYSEFDSAYTKAAKDFGLANVSEKTKYDLFNDALYSANDDARKVQKKENPELLKEDSYDFLSPSREELMNEVQSLHAKVEALMDYIDNLTTIIKTGLTDIVDTVDGGA